MKILAISTLALASLAAAGHARAGDFQVTGGWSQVDPRSATGPVADGAFESSIDGDGAGTLGLAWVHDSGLGVELWGALDKFTHTVSLNGAQSANIRHQPLALSAQYYFNAGESFRPFVGLGYHHTNVDGESTTGPLAGTRLGVETGQGAMATAGVDFLMGERVFARVDARYLDWSSDLALDGAPIGTVNVDPWVIGASVGVRF